MRVCPDTNYWIARLLDPRPWHAVTAGPASGGGRTHVFLATIVLQELWAGARAPDQRAYAERLYETARGARRLLNPPAAAWILSGQTLRILDSRRGLSGARLRALRNDVLLAATAFVHGAAVMTRNTADFKRIAEVLPVRVVRPPGHET